MTRKQVRLFIMTNLETSLQHARKRWLEAKSKGDIIMMDLWKKVGLSIKARVAERMGLQTKEQEMENIFGGKLK